MKNTLPLTRGSYVALHKQHLCPAFSCPSFELTLSHHSDLQTSLHASTFLPQREWVEILGATLQSQWDRDRVRMRHTRTRGVAGVRAGGEVTDDSVCMLRLRAPILESLCAHSGHLLPIWENISSFTLHLSGKYMLVALCPSSLTSKFALYGEEIYILIMFWIDFIDIWEHNLSINYTRDSQCYYSYLIFNPKNFPV